MHQYRRDGGLKAEAFSKMRREYQGEGEDKAGEGIPRNPFFSFFEFGVGLQDREAEPDEYFKRPRGLNPRAPEVGDIPVRPWRGTASRI
jgi:hypothetical protein